MTTQQLLEVREKLAGARPAVVDLRRLVLECLEVLAGENAVAERRLTSAASMLLDANSRIVDALRELTADTERRG